MRVDRCLRLFLILRRSAVGSRNDEFSHRIVWSGLRKFTEAVHGPAWPSATRYKSSSIGAFAFASKQRLRSGNFDFVALRLNGLTHQLAHDYSTAHAAGFEAPTLLCLHEVCALVCALAVSLSAALPLADMCCVRACRP